MANPRVHVNDVYEPLGELLPPADDEPVGQPDVPPNEDDSWEVC